MKTNSLRPNVRHIQDALAALSFLAASPLPSSPPNLPPTPMALLSDTMVLKAVYRALTVGATLTEVAVVAGLDDEQIATVKVLAAKNRIQIARRSW